MRCVARTAQENHEYSNIIVWLLSPVAFASSDAVAAVCPVVRSLASAPPTTVRQPLLASSRPPRSAPRNAFCVLRIALRARALAVRGALLCRSVPFRSVPFHSIPFLSVPFPLALCAPQPPAAAAAAAAECQRQFPPECTLAEAELSHSSVLCLARRGALHSVASSSSAASRLHMLPSHERVSLRGVAPLWQCSSALHLPLALALVSRAARGESRTRSSGAEQLSCTL